MLAKFTSHGVSVRRSDEVGVIYVIRCMPSAREYIGSSARHYDRWTRHLYCLRRGTHHSPALQAKWNVHGEEMFSFEVIAQVLPGQSLIELEQQAINSRKSYPGGYNGSSTAGKPDFSAEQRRKLSIARRRRPNVPCSPETKVKISAANIGKKRTPEQCLTLSKAKTGVRLKIFPDVQEQIVLLSRVGMSNREIGRRLHLHHKPIGQILNALR